MGTNPGLALDTLFAICRRADLPDQGRRPLPIVLEEVLAELGAFPELDRAAVYLDDQEAEGPTFQAGAVRSTGRMAPVGADPFSLDEAVLRRCATVGGPYFLVPDEDAPRRPDRGAAPDGQALVGASVTDGDGSLGCLVLEGFCPPGAEARVRTERLDFCGMAAAVIGRLVSLDRRVRARTLALEREILSLRGRISETCRRLFLIGDGQAVQRLRREVEAAALTQAPVLLSGEPGSGRELAARAVHELSGRAVRPFAALFAAGKSEAVLAAELFGRALVRIPVLQAEEAATESESLPEAGPGLVERADGGALYLDDAAALPEALQRRLVHFLGRGEFCREQGSKVRTADVRLLLAVTPSRPLAGPLAEALAGRFRPDRLDVPPLRERPGDIPALVNERLEVLTLRLGRRPSLTPAALKALETCDWPGNVRELEETLTRAAVTASGEKIDLADIPAQALTRAGESEPPPPDAGDLKDLERRQVLTALGRHEWNQSRAARELGLTLRQIGYRIKKFGLRPE